MFKGCKKHVIQVKNTGSKYFEQAYFILKDNCNGEEAGYDDMILEANRIVEKSVNKKDKSFRVRKGFISFGFGICFCAFIYTLILLFLGGI